MRARRPLVAGLVVLALAGVTACAPAVTASWSPPQWPDTTLTVVSAVETHAQVPDTAIATQRIRNDAVGIQARYALAPGAAMAAFNAAVTSAVWHAVDAAEAASGVSYTPQVFGAGAGLGDRACVAGSTTVPATELLADPALAGSQVTLVCEIIWAHGDLLGQRLRTLVPGAEGTPGDTVETIWGTAEGAVFFGDEIWTAEAAASLAAEIVETSRRAAGSLSLRAIDDPGALGQIQNALETSVPSADGGMQFTLPAGFRAPELEALGVAATTEPVTIRVPSERARPLLTPEGLALLDSAGKEYAGARASDPGDDPVDCALTPCVALTYDDGPSSLTPRLLEVLREHRARATFYVLGQYAAGNPDTVRETAAAGHEIGNHTWSHPSLPALTAEQVREQIARTGALLRELTGQPVATFRPPYGEYTSAVLVAADLPAMIWSVDTRDWAGPEDDVLLARAVTEPRPGGIVLFHDTHERSVRLAPEIIEGLRDRGFTFATITELFHDALPESGAWRSAPAR